MNQPHDQHLDTIERLVIFLTFNCNFNCSYCYVKKRNSDELENKEFIEIINKLTKENSSIKELNFMGGEPLIRFDLVKEIIETFEKTLRFNLNTNGSLLDKNILNYLSEKNVTVILSLDGSTITQDLNRKSGSFNKILKNISGFEEELIINYVINNNSINNLILDINNLLKLGFKKIDVRPNSDYLWKKGELRILNREVQKLYFLYYKLYKKMGIVFLLEKIIGKNIYYENEKGCNELKISPDGHFFSCCRLCNDYENDKKLDFGKNNFNNKKRDMFLKEAREKINAIRTKKSCNMCKIRNNCLCMIDTYYLKKDNFSEWFDSYCMINKIMIGNLIKAKKLFSREIQKESLEIRT